MKSPRQMLQKTLTPMYQFYKKYISKDAIRTYTTAFSNFVYDHSKDVATMMLAGYAASTISSHLAQINGLKKSKRENKDFLIKQEETELKLDLLLTILPPFLIKNAIDKQLTAGKVTTKKSRELLTTTVASTVGITEKEIYFVHPKEPLKVVLDDKLHGILRFLKKRNLIPKKYIDKLKIKPKDLNKRVPMANLADMATDFDEIILNMKKNALAKDPNARSLTAERLTSTLYKGSAEKELCGQKEGFLIIPTVFYTILAANIIMPILKNKLANKRYREELAQIGETPESIKRKKRYNFNSTEFQQTTNNAVFSNFTNTPKVQPKEEYNRNIYSNLKVTQNSTFSTFYSNMKI